MNTRVLGALGAASLVVALAAAPAQALDKARMNVAFAFSAADVTFPAGNYEFFFEKEGQLTIREVAGGKHSVVSCSTRLSPRQISKPVLVFDKAGDKSYLTELYFPGADGYFLKGAPGKHTHILEEATE
jgi:hypothetical protein